MPDHLRDALRDRSQKRHLQRQGVDELREVWQKALQDTTPGVPMDDVLDRIERKYQDLADETGR